MSEYFNDKGKLYSFYKKKLFNNAEFNKDQLTQQLRELNRDYERVLEEYFVGKMISKVYINGSPADNEFDITIVYKFYENNKQY